mmetsp:Transcript_13838/g.30937  ORF Transcript_13838/g.30937 Transcript_13838/m.30937 type:complete len:104 (-) Transcript_13838:1306-1617(-)
MLATQFSIVCILSVAVDEFHDLFTHKILRIWVLILSFLKEDFLAFQTKRTNKTNKKHNEENVQRAQAQKDPVVHSGVWNLFTLGAFLSFPVIGKLFQRGDALQ